MSETAAARQNYLKSPQKEPSKKKNPERLFWFGLHGRGSGLLLDSVCVSTRGPGRPSGGPYPITYLGTPGQTGSLSPQDRVRQRAKPPFYTCRTCHLELHCPPLAGYTAAGRGRNTSDPRTKWGALRARTSSTHVIQSASPFLSFISSFFSERT